MKNVYFFGVGKADGTGKQKELLGGKGAGLAEMTLLGLPVPPGFTITTEACTYYYQHDRTLPPGLEAEARAAALQVGEIMGARFGDRQNPLLLSVRSGARVSMPGMMDTVLNLGLNDETVQGLIERTGNPRFAYDSYRRFVAMYGDVVMGLKPETEKDHDPFEEILDEKKRARGVERDIDLSAEDLKDLVSRFKAEIRTRKGVPFPEDPWEQLWGAIQAVFRSWDNPRARTYRKLYGYPDHWGTAVTVQAMVFGNMGDDCATGVAFTRDPATGDRRFFGEFLVNAQGEDVVAGIRTPRPISELEEVMPKAYRELLEIRDRLEKHLRDMQDVEFTIQRGKLWMLQTRSGKRSGRAMVKIAVDFVAEKTIEPKEAILRVDPNKIDELLHPMIDPSATKKVIAKGLPASPGAAIGKVAFSATEAEERAEKGEKVILVRVETSPEDVHGMKAAQGILTSRGGMTSHAAVVARGMGKCCVVGASAIQVDYRKGIFTAGNVTVRDGDVITLDGSTGEVILGTVPLVPARLDEDYRTLMTWVDGARRLRVRTNADTPVDARTARAFGAEGIGLCRTEHMFFDPQRILAMRQMILASDEKGRRAALEKILPMQQGDFLEIFRVMDGLPVTVRLLDPPLHEFLPRTEAEISEVARALGVSVEAVHAKNEELHEANPMLGHRGCRLAVTYPEIYETQVTAIARAACLARREGVTVLPEIMIPIVGIEGELSRLRELVVTTFEQVAKSEKLTVPFTVGTMIELPRACIVADELARHADFFSFGTNDLTQTAFGFSRDDIGKLLPIYLEKHLVEKDPFAALDRDGVGKLMGIAVEKGRKAKSGLKIGICGEHGGEPSSVEFCHALGLDYVSCSPFRVPIARLSAAQAALKAGNP
ncbi:MAG: pyruvate, phosphate dikinase [Deltaproteobacteria bacterium]|nr:pyruvate, phosphate dikinase [Deltaproteobacteria bacterium]